MNCTENNESKRTPELQASIEHWRHSSTLTHVNQFREVDIPYADNCALCEKHRFVGDKGSCETCDIYLHTHECFCDGTPYTKAFAAFWKLADNKPNNWPEASAKMVKFLESVTYPKVSKFSNEDATPERISS